MKADVSPRVLPEHPARDSDDVFPPQTSRGAEIDALIELLRGVFQTRSALYVSVPITSGRRFLEWYSSFQERSGQTENYQAGHLNHVIAPNRSAAAALVKRAREISSVVIDPTAVDHIEGWTQGDFRTAWARVIEEFARTVMFADGWEFSNGCSYEFLIAKKAGLQALDESLRPIDLQTGLSMIRRATDELLSGGLAVEFLRGIERDLASLAENPVPVTDLEWPVENKTFKDSVLDSLANHGNVAQFVSFSPRLELRYSRIVGHDPNAALSSLSAAVGVLLDASAEHSVNVRSYHPEHPKSREFIYGLRDVGAVEDAVRRLAREGLYTIVNETIDVNDGGVSGVALGDVMEFAPGDTPRCVEKPGALSLPRSVGMSMLQRVYSFAPSFPAGHWRLEFSIHPLPRGYRQGHTILWEAEHGSSTQPAPNVRWPNRFSRFLGDKAFGLLLADCLGFPVPSTVVISRLVAPFVFGRSTGTGETWLRTCPKEPVPGKFVTQRGWADPFKLLEKEDPEQDALASVLSQEGVRAVTSGASIGSTEGPPIIEGVKGLGTEFMLGQKAAESLPPETVGAVKELIENVVRVVGGTIKLEWAFDGELVWILQMQQIERATEDSIIVPGEPKCFRRFDVARGIDHFREFVADAQRSGDGVILAGGIGITSHFGDILRRSGVPSRVER
jgi:hypothetical protein